LRIETCTIFDIDGTLLDSSSFENRLYLDAIREVLGDPEIDSDWTHYEHVSDAGILMEVCRRRGASIIATMVGVRERFGELVAAHFAAGGSCPRLLAPWLCSTGSRPDPPTRSESRPAAGVTRRR
jgi:hypothetical protein